MLWDTEEIGRVLGSQIYIYNSPEDIPAEPPRGVNDVFIDINLGKVYQWDGTEWKYKFPIPNDSRIVDIVAELTALGARLEDEESARVVAENARVSAEQSRVAAETEREGNEDLRKSAERSREAAEQGRVVAEGTRNDNESLREEAEDARQTAEGNRAIAEGARATAEASRASAESARATAESGRVSAEQARVSAESARATAEGNRATAETARANAESARASAETARQTNESTRQSQEQTRQSQESARQTAEGARVGAEQERAQNEVARQVAESNREDAEGLRVQAENTRAANDALWNEHEQTRQANEAQRVLAEQARVEAEAGRQAELDSKITFGSGWFDGSGSVHYAEEAGLAEGIATDRTIDNPEDSCPAITFGTVGGEAEIQTGINKFQTLYGNSIKYNEKLLNPNFDTSFRWEYDGSGTLNISNGIATFTASAINSGIKQGYLTIEANHKYICSIRAKLTTAGTYLRLDLRDGTGVQVAGYSKSTTDWQIIVGMVSAGTTNVNGYFRIFDGRQSGWDAFQVDYANVVDLTAMGITATTTDEAIAALKALGVDIYQSLPYNESAILSSKSASLISRGFNQWDEVYEQGYYNNDLTPASSTNNIRSKNFIKVLPNTQYFFRSGASTESFKLFYCDDAGNVLSAESIYGNVTFITPSGCTQIKFFAYTTYGGTYNHDICINLNQWGDTIDTSRNGEYVPYRSQTVTLPNIELRSVPNYADPDNPIRDVAYQIGGGKRRVGRVKLNTLTFTRGLITGSSTEHAFYIDNEQFVVNAMFNSSALESNLFICGYDNVKYETFTGSIKNKTTAGYRRSGGTQLFAIKDDSYNDATTFKNHFGENDYLYFELATETDIPTSENPGWTENVYTDNWGTLEFTTDPVQNPQVPQPYFIEYTISLTEWVDSAYTRTSGDANNLALQKDVDAIVDGNTEVGKATLATNIEAKGKVENNEPYAMRATPSGVAEDCLVDDVVGVDVVKNQLINYATDLQPTSSQLGVTKTKNDDNTFTMSGTADGGTAYLYFDTATYNLEPTSKYIVFAFGSFNKMANVRMQTKVTSESSPSYVKANEVFTGYTILNQMFVFVNDGETASGNVWFAFMNLTQRYGSNEVVNAIIGADASTQVARLLAFDPDILKDLSYDAGTLVNVKVAGRKAVNANAWDGTYENGFLDSSTGAEIAGSGSDKRSLFIDVIGGATYYFGRDSSIVGINNGIYCFYDAGKNFISSAEHTRNTTFAVPFNAKYMRFAFVNVDHPERMQSTIVINLSNPTINGQYIAHDEQTYQMEPVDLHGVYKVVNGKVVADGDVYPPSGNKVTNYFSYTFTGEENWVADTIEGNKVYSIGFPVAKEVGNYAVYTQLITSIPNSYNAMRADVWAHPTARGYAMAYRRFNISEALYNDRANLVGKTICFAVETPTESEASPYPRNQKAYQGGTEEWLAPEGHVNPPVGHDTSYLPDLANKLEASPDSPTTDGTYVMQRANGQNSYTALDTWLGNNGYNKMQVLSSQFVNLNCSILSDNESGAKYFLSFSIVTDHENFTASDGRTAFENLLQWMYTQGGRYNSARIPCNGIIRLAGGTVLHAVELMVMGGSPIGYSIRCIAADGTDRQNITRTDLQITTYMEQYRMPIGKNS